MRVVLGWALAVAFLVSRLSLLIQIRSFSFSSTQSLRVCSSGSLLNLSALNRTARDFLTGMTLR